MIRIRYQECGGQRWLKVEGHAGYNAGEDIVCAGVSGIVYALLGYLENNRDILGEVRSRVAAGDTEVYCRRGAEEAFQMAVIGLRQIAQAYPEHVAVEG